MLFFAFYVHILQTVSIVPHSGINALSLDYIFITLYSPYFQARKDILYFLNSRIYVPLKKRVT